MKKVVSFLRDSKISEYTNIMSNEEVIKSLLKSEAGQISAETTFVDESIKSNDELIKVLADVFQSLTTKAMTTREIIEYIYDNFKPELGKEVNNELGNILGDSIKIVHANNYNLNCKNKDIKTLQDATPFVLIKELPFGQILQKDSKNRFIESYYYGHNLNSSTKQLSAEFGGDYFQPARFGLSQLNKLIDPETGQVYFEFAKKSDEDSGIGLIFNCEEMTDAKVARTDGVTGTISEQTYFNALDADKNLIENKDNTSVSVVMLNNPNIRAGTKNSLELSTFLNILSTIELSKCQPYFNATFVLPDAMQNLTGKIFKTASITQFLEGTIDIPWDNAVSDLYNTLEASFVREINRKKDEEFVESTGTTTNMSAFTMPQTINNFDEVFVGHDEVLELNKNRLFKRANQIHDITRPFMTIKSFNIDVAPTQGLMSFKTGKLSLILHDRTRMVDIAPFIKPDLFGSFGAEISIEYGWSHLDAHKLGKELKEKDISHIAEFLDKTRVIEKYIITNSSYRISGNGQVDIDLSIAMRGPVDIRTVFLDIDAPKKITHSNIQKKKQSYTKSKNDFFERLKGTDKKQPTFAFSNIPGDKLLADTLTVTDATNYDAAVTKKIKDFSNHFRQFKRKVLGISTSKEVSMSDFVEELNTAWRTADEDFNNTYFDASSPMFYVQHPVGSSSTEEESTGRKITPAEQRAFIKSVLVGSAYGKSRGVKDHSYEQLLSTVQSNISGVVSARRKAQNNLVKKLIAGLGEVDPFYDKEWLKQYYLYSEAQYDDKSVDKSQIRDNFLPIYGIKPYGATTNKKGETSYVSFGCIVVAIITSHLACIGKFDEIQIVSYTANSFCGLMSNRNIMSFLINREELKTFLFELFSKEAKYTIEAIITQICQRFISTRDQICYGIKSLYTRDGDKSIRPKNQNVKKHQQSVNKALQRIYESRQDDDKSKAKIEKVVFLMPKIKFSFDTLTTKESGYLKTISRISIFDQQDNPFGSVKEIMEKVYDENIILAAAEINRIRSETFSTKDAEAEKAGKRTPTVDKFYAKAHAIIKDLEEREVIIREGNAFRVAGSFRSNSLKQEFKRIMPSATYGTQNNALLEASISTINEANLNTVYLTRPDRNAPDSLAKITFGNDLPLRILPAQADITIYGCPFINFAQYMFLDFETGTTIDNTYAVTGIKHDMTPGKFTTSLTLSYGDVYGKYENAVETIKKVYDPDDNNSAVRFFGGNILIEGIDGTSPPDDLSTEIDLPTSQIDFYNVSPVYDKVQDYQYSKTDPFNKITAVSEEFSARFKEFRNDDNFSHDLFRSNQIQIQVFSYNKNKVFATFKESGNTLVSKLKIAVDFKTTYNKKINYKIPIKNKKLNEYLESFFTKTDLIFPNVALDVVNKNMINKNPKSDNYIIKNVLDIIKLKFSLDSFFVIPKIFGVMFFFSFDIIPLTSGSFSFDPEDSQIKLDFSRDFSIFDNLSDKVLFENYFSNDLSLAFSERDSLFYESEKNKIVSIKIDIDNKTETKLPIIIQYKTKIKRKEKKITVKLYFNKDDDREISSLFKSKALEFLNQNIFNFKQIEY